MAKNRGESQIMTQAARDDLPKHHKATKDDVMVIGASSLGTVFEWYDFYLYGLLTTYITHTFFSGVNETTGFILALAAFGAGFAVRPFGALVFGWIGDVVGRKNTFLVTMGIMGVSNLCRGLFAQLRRNWRSGADHLGWAFGYCKALRLVVNMAGRRPMWQNMRPIIVGGFTQVGYRPRRP